MRVLRMKLYRCNFNRRFKNVCQYDDVIVREIHNKHMGIPGLTDNLSSVLELHVLNHAHRNQEWLGRVELDT
jgi:hypothetical protein